MFERQCKEPLTDILSVSHGVYLLFAFGLKIVRIPATVECFPGFGGVDLDIGELRWFFIFWPCLKGFKGVIFHLWKRLLLGKSQVSIHGSQMASGA